MEKRRHPRMDNLQLTADISDGERFFSGELTNLSRFGLCLDGIPSKIDHTARRMSVVLSGNGENFKLLTRPCWSWEEGRVTMLGLEILKAPWGWTEYVLGLEPAIDDIWAETEM